MKRKDSQKTKLKEISEACKNYTPITQFVSLTFLKELDKALEEDYERHRKRER